MYYIGVDIGGTNLKVGLIQGENLIDKIIRPTNSFDLVRQIVNVIQEILEKNNIEITNLAGVGVGCPGIVKNGVVTHSVNLNLSEFNLQEILAQELGVRVIVLNDGDMATLAEHKLGAGKNCENMVLITIGTGVGGGIIVKGELYKGTEGAGELGHIPLQFGDRPCNCGQKGCVEQYVSCVALSKMAIEEMKNYPDSVISIKDGEVRASSLVEAYERNDACAIKVINQYVEYLGAGVMAYCNIFRPDTIVIGGGISYAPKIIELVDKYVTKMNYGYPYSNKVRIAPATLGSDAGILGTVVAFDQMPIAEIEESNENDIILNLMTNQDTEGLDDF